MRINPIKEKIINFYKNNPKEIIKQLELGCYEDTKGLSLEANLAFKALKQLLNKSEVEER